MIQVKYAVNMVRRLYVSFPPVICRQSFGANIFPENGEPMLHTRTRHSGLVA